MSVRSLAYYRAALAPSRFFQSRPEGRQVPVFMYHHAEPRPFEQHLRFLEQNGYRAASCDQVDWSDPDPRDVVLTFDDGRRSVWSVVAPLLEKYGFRATAFVSPGMIGEGDPTPTLATGAVGELKSHGYGNHELFNWTEAQLLARGDAVDLQLHGFAHSRVFVSPRLRGFHFPGRRDVDEGIAGWIVRKGGADEVVRELEYGQPIYTWASRWGEAARFLEDEGASAACIDLVQMRGGEEFFRGGRWRDELEAVWRTSIRDEPNSHRYEAPSEKRARLEDLLRRARDLLEERTGVRAEHFALPWADGNEMVSEVAAAAGVRHVYWEASLPVDAQDSERPVLHHYRLKDQSLLRLPGEGRQGLPAVFAVVARSYLTRFRTPGLTDEH